MAILSEIVFWSLIATVCLWLTIQWLRRDLE